MELDRYKLNALVCGFGPPHCMGKGNIPDSFFYIKCLSVAAIVGEIEWGVGYIEFALPLHYFCCNSGC